MTPNWSSWERKGQVMLWEAAALACNIDPTTYKHGPIFETSLDSLLPAVPQDLTDLLEQAKSAVGAGVLRVDVKHADSLINRDVDLVDFATWLRTIRHKPPAKFQWTPRLLEPAEFQWPWGSYQTNELVLLARAADKFWRNYDPSDPTTAPKNKDVEDWLVEQHIPRSKAQTIASLLRADDLPQGRR